MVRKFVSYNKEIKKGLYLVSTPIGNLGDITLRALAVLRESDYILCEDTRVSKVLLEKYEIKSKLISNHKFNENKNLLKIMELLNKGLVVSLVSDAGTPSISDPGAILVKKCVENNIEIFPVSGPSAVSSAISEARLPNLPFNRPLICSCIFSLSGILKSFPLKSPFSLNILSLSLKKSPISAIDSSIFFLNSSSFIASNNFSLFPK